MKYCFPRKDLPPTDHGMALQLVRFCKANEDLSNQCPQIISFLHSQPMRYAKICRRAASLCASPERKATFLLEAVHHHTYSFEQAEWRVEFMVRCLEDSQPLLVQEFKDNGRRELLLERWRDAAIMVFHAAGYFRACADAYKERACAAGNRSADKEVYANQFMAEVELCNSALVQGIRETVRNAVIRLKGSAGRLLLHLSETPNDVYWRVACLIHILRAEWFVVFHNPDHQESFAELAKLRKKIPGNFTAALKVLTAAYYTRRSYGEWGDALSVARGVALNSRENPDWRAEAYLVLALAMIQSGYKIKAKVYLKDILDLPQSGGHVAKSVARTLLRLINEPS